MYKLLAIPLAAYIQAWFEVLQGNYVWSVFLASLGFVLWLAILDSIELLKEV